MKNMNINILKIIPLSLLLLIVSCGGPDTSDSSSDSASCASVATSASVSTSTYNQHSNVDILKLSKSIVLDIDGDGIINAYDGDPYDANFTVIGDGTQDNPYIINNEYQLQAIAGRDHQGNDLAKSYFTNHTYLYANNLEEQLNKYYMLAEPPYETTTGHSLLANSNSN